MSDLLSRALPPPKNWQDFEALTFDLFRQRWKTNDAQMHGRRGQAQAGVDVYGHDRVEGDAFAGVQCKGKDADYGGELTEAELEAEVAKALTFQPPLKVFTLVTTAPNDAKIQAAARRISERHNQIGLFEVRVEGWDTLRQYITDYPELVQKHFSDFAPVDLLTQVKGIVDQLDDQRRMQVAHHQQHTKLIIDRTGDDINDEIAVQATELAKLIEDGLPRAAITALQRLLDDKSKAASALAKFRILANIGNAYSSMNEDDKACEYFERAFAEHPHYPGAKAILATARMLQGCRNEAHELAVTALTEDPELVRAAGIIVETEDRSVSTEELKAKLSGQTLSKWEVQLALARREFFVGNTEYAAASVETILIANQNWQTQSTLAEMLMKPLVEDQDIVLTRIIPDTEKAQYNRAVELLQLAWGTLSGRDDRNIGKHVGANLITLLELGGRVDEAEKVLDEAIAKLPDYPPLLQRYAVRAIGLDDWAAAYNAINSIPESELEFDDLLLKTQACVRLGKRDEAIATSERVKAVATSDEHKVIALAIGIEAAVSAGQDPQTLTERALKQFPKSITIRSLALEHFDRTSEYAVKIQSELEELSKGIISTRERIHAADALYRAGQYDQCATLLDGLHGSDVDSHILYRHLSALHRADRRMDARALFESLSSELKLSPRYIRLGISIYENSGLLVPAIELITASLAQKDNLRDRLVWMQLLLRQGDNSFVDGWLRKVSSAIEGDPHDLIVLAQFIDQFIGSDRRSLEIGHRALRKGYSDPQIHLAYSIGLFLMGRSTGLALTHPTTIEVGVGAVLRDAANNETMFRVVVDAKEVFPERDEISVADAQKLELLGKKVGETISVPRIGAEPLVYRIEELSDQFLFAHFGVLRKFTSLFPGHPAFGQVDIDDSKGDDRFEPIFALARDRADFADEIAKVYRSGVAPVAIISKLAGSSVFDLFDGLRSGPDGQWRVAIGAKAEFDKATADAGNGLWLVDPLTIYGWQRSGLLEVVGKIQNRLAIVQSSLDSLHEQLHERTQAKGKHLGSLGWNGENYVMTNLTDADVDRLIDQMGQVLDFAKKLTLVASEAPEHPDAQIAELLEESHPAFYDTLLAAKQSGRAVLTDDFGYRSLIAATGIPTIWTQIALAAGLNDRSISQTEYRHAITALVENRYYFTMFGHTELADSLRECNWAPDHAVELYVNEMSKESVDLPSLATTIAMLIIEQRKDELDNADLSRIHIAIFEKLIAEGRGERAKQIYKLVFQKLEGIFARNVKSVMLIPKLMLTTSLVPIRVLAREFDEAAARGVLKLQQDLEEGGFQI